jgi:hypothetical protein
MGKGELCQMVANSEPAVIGLGACRRGQVLLANVNEATMVPFVSQQLNNLDLALALAKRGNLPGAEALVGHQFERLFQSGQYKEAAEAAAESPQVMDLPYQQHLAVPEPRFGVGSGYNSRTLFSKAYVSCVQHQWRVGLTVIC